MKYLSALLLVLSVALLSSCEKKEWTAEQEEIYLTDYCNANREACECVLNQIQYEYTFAQLDSIPEADQRKFVVNCAGFNFDGLNMDEEEQIR